MEKRKSRIKKTLGDKTLLNMAGALNEIRVDFELLDEQLDRDGKIKALKDIRDDLIDIFWNYDLVKKNQYERDNK